MKDLQGAGHPAPHRVRFYAAKGLNMAMVAEKFDLLEEEFKTLLKKDKGLRRAYELGCVAADSYTHQQIWDSGDTGLLLLKARMRLKMEDPVLDALTGNLLKTVLSKMDKKTQQTLSNVLSVKK